MHGVAGSRGQRFDMLARHPLQAHLRACLKAQFQKLGPERITDPRRKTQITPPDQGRGKAMGGAAMQPQSVGQVRQTCRARRYRFQHIQAAKQGLASGKPLHRLGRRRVGVFHACVSRHEYRSHLIGEDELGPVVCIYCAGIGAPETKSKRRYALFQYLRCSFRA
jgi:hypothetical protein